MCIRDRYIALAGLPLIHHALAALCACERIERVWVVLSPGDEWWGSFDWTSLGSKLYPVFCGGASRGESVANGLAAAASVLADDDWVMVQDVYKRQVHRYRGANEPGRQLHR